MKKLIALLAIFGFIVAANADIGGEFPARFGRIDGVGRVPIARVLCRSAVAVSAPADTNEDTLATCTVPANAIGASGTLRITAFFSITNSANTKTIKVHYSGAAGNNVFNASPSTLNAYGVRATITNKNASTQTQLVTSEQIAAGQELLNVYNTAGFNIDTTADTSLVFTCQKQLATESCSLDFYIIELISDGT